MKIEKIIPSPMERGNFIGIIGCSKKKRINDKYYTKETL